MTRSFSSRPTVTEFTVTDCVTLEVLGTIAFSVTAEFDISIATILGRYWSDFSDDCSQRIFAACLGQIEEFLLHGDTRVGDLNLPEDFAVELKRA